MRTSKTSRNPSVHDSIHLHPVRLYSHYSVAILTNLSPGTVLVFMGTRTILNPDLKMWCDFDIHNIVVTNCQLIQGTPGNREISV